MGGKSGEGGGSLDAGRGVSDPGGDAGGEGAAAGGDEDGVRPVRHLLQDLHRDRPLTRSSPVV